MTSPARLALLYLALPPLLFLPTWIGSTVALPMLALLLAALVVSLHVGRASTPHRPQAWLIAAGAAILVLGIAGFPNGPFAWDWIKHWALLNTLTRHPWPIVIELNQQPAFLRFYVAAYLVPAAMKKLAPDLPIAVATATWFGLGLLLLFRIAVPAGQGAKRGLLATLLLLTMGGADLWAEQLFRVNELLPPTSILGLHHEAWFINAWRAQLQFTSILAALVWVPHQAIATFMVAALIHRGYSLQPAGMLALGLLALWSPYGLIGLLAVIAVSWWSDRPLAWRSPAVPLAALTAGAFVFLVAWYLTTELPPDGVCLACVPARVKNVGIYLIFWSVELAPFLLILGRRSIDEPLCRAALMLLICVTPLHGATADFVMRASLGPLFLLTMRCAETATEPGAARCWTILLALLLCAPTALSEAIYHRQHGEAHRSLPIGDPLRQRWMITFAERTDIDVKQFFDICGWHLRSQYFTQSPPGPVRISSWHSRNVPLRSE